MSSITNVTPQLRRTWHPIGRVETFGDEPTRVEVIGEGYVVVRLDGRLEAFLDVCPHRNARLSDGRLVNGLIECPYHGWRFDADGRCAHVPALGEGATMPPARLTRFAASTLAVSSTRRSSSWRSSTVMSSRTFGGR